MKNIANAILLLVELCYALCYAMCYLPIFFLRKYLFLDQPDGGRDQGPRGQAGSNRQPASPQACNDKHPHHHPDVADPIRKRRLGDQRRAGDEEEGGQVVNGCRSDDACHVRQIGVG